MITAQMATDANQILDWYLRVAEKVSGKPYAAAELAVAAYDRDQMLVVLLECMPQTKKCGCGRCGR